jgi:hypothetical protein
MLLLSARFWKLLDGLRGMLVFSAWFFVHVFARPFLCLSQLFPGMLLSCLYYEHMSGLQS